MIFCIEDDELMRDMIVFALQKQGYTVEAASEYCENSCSTRPALVIADMAVCAKVLENLRKEFAIKGVPVLYLAARMDRSFFCDENTQNEYLLEKPFDIEILLKRISEISQISKKADKRSITYKKLKFCVEKNRVEINGSVISLTQKESALLYVLINSPGEIFSKKRLFYEVWDSDYLGESRTVDVHIGTLRTKLGDVGKYIKTVRGRGYYIEKCEGENNEGNKASGENN